VKVSYALFRGTLSPQAFHRSILARVPETEKTISPDNAKDFKIGFIWNTVAERMNDLASILKD
jgi:hypothetical protein